MTEWPKLRKEPGVGAFYVTYRFMDSLTQEEMLAMGEWLSYHCEENFIFLEKTSCILAGGTSNNIAYWDHQVNKTPHTHWSHAANTSHEIRLHAKDQGIFEMTWGNLLTHD